MHPRIYELFTDHTKDQLIMVPSDFFEYLKVHFGVDSIATSIADLEEIVSILDKRNDQSVYRLYFSKGAKEAYALFIDNEPFFFVKKPEMHRDVQLTKSN